MSTGRWSELSAEHEVRCTEEGRSLVITMSRTSGIIDRLYQLEIGVFISVITQELSPRGQPRVPVDMFSNQVTGQQDQQLVAITSVQVHSDQWASGPNKCTPQGL
jgi:hypothetical protein